MSPIPMPRRSALFLPASNPRAIAKARGLAADIIILDLEDAVAPEAKDAARAAAVAAVAEGGFAARTVAIRVNARDTEWGATDLAAVAGSGADAVLVPKIAESQDVRAYDSQLAAAPAGLQMWAMVETCASVGALFAIAAAAADSRLALLCLGLNDLAREMGAELGGDRAPFLPLVAQAVCAARAHGLAVLDGVCNDFTDPAVVAAEAAQGRRFGCDGKALIHPDQIAPVNAAFTPSPGAVAAARAIVAAFAAPENAGRGAIRVAGRMAERLHLDQARRTLALADAADD